VASEGRDRCVTLSHYCIEASGLWLQAGHGGGVLIDFDLFSFEPLC
jgi:hypothetical protein